MQVGRMTRGKIAAVAMVGAAVLGGGGATAWAATTGASASSTPAASAPASTSPSTSKPAATPKATKGHKGKSHHGTRSLLARSDHATVEVKSGTTWVTDTYDRGTVTAASGSSITLHRPDGQNVTLAITPTTKFKGVTSASGLVTGKEALVVSTAGQATHIAERSATTKS
jgi:hypothetical protein